MSQGLLFAILSGLCVGAILFAAWGHAGLPVATRNGRTRTAVVAGIVTALVVLILPLIL